jgi:hypothetical protein
MLSIAPVAGCVAVDTRRVKIPKKNGPTRSSVNLIVSELVFWLAEVEAPMPLERKVR